MASKKLKALSDDEVWTRWNERMTRVRHELHAVFSTRWKFREMTRMFEENDALKAIGGDVHRWIFSMWARDVVIAVRRELDNDRNTVCLGRLLDEMAQRPEVITRERYTRGMSPDNFILHMLNKTFDDWGVKKPASANPLKDYLDPAGIAKDRRHLSKVARPVLAYANQLVAHRSETEEVRVTLGEVNLAVDEIEEVFKKYYAIINGPALSGLEPSMIGDWWAPFRIPWMAPKPEDA